MKTLLLSLVAATALLAQGGKTHLKVGDMAPGFEKLPSSVPGKAFSLADFKGQQNVVRAFFPLAFTGG